MRRMILLRLLLLPLIVPTPGNCLSQDRYIINADLPADIVQNATIIDTLPRGLIYRNDSLNITGADNFDAHISGPNDGSFESVITWNFGSVNNTADKDLQISFAAVVGSVPGNRAGVTLHPNKATLKWRDSHGLHSSTDEAVPVEIVEPDLNIEKRINPESCCVGGNISCIISICHSSKSCSDAFDVDLTEYLPAGLVYIPGSMKILTGLAGILDNSSSSMLIWHFNSIDSSWGDGSPVLLEYNATVQEDGPYTSKSSLRWTSAQGLSPYERTYSAECEIAPVIENKKKGLSITKTALDQAHPGCAINYTIAYENNGPIAHNVIIKEIYDSNTTFLSAHPSPDAGTDYTWTIGNLQQGDFGKIELSALVNSSAKQGTILDNIVKLTSDESDVSSESKTTVIANQPSLEINATASSEFIRPGGSINYTIAFRNAGPGEATNISITDTIDSHLQLIGSTPEPTKIWSDNMGTHLFWSAATLNTSKMRQGESGEIRLNVCLPPIPEHPDIDSVYNIYRIDSDNAESKQGSLETFVIHSLFVRKSADKDACSEGETVNFTIIYGNDLAVEANNAVLTDRLTGMDYVYAVPVPEIKGDMLTWTLGTLPPHTERSILLCTMIKRRPEIHLQNTQLVFGEGYVDSSLRLSATTEPHEVVNYANITASYLKKPESDSSFVKIKILDLSGAGMESSVKGSGSYNMDQTIDYRSDKSMSFDKEISASYSPVKIHLVQNNLTVNSLWEERTRAENRARDEVITENYRYMSHLDSRESSLTDENQTVFSSNSDFGSGLAQISYQRNAPDSAEDSIGVSENYYGSFRIKSSLDSYGDQAVYSRSSSGSGFVSSQSQASGRNANINSNEHGSGLYESREAITNDPTARKDINLSYASFDWSVGSLKAVYADKWSEGSAVENSELESKIGEKISLADHIQEETLIDSSSLSLASEFTGIGSLWASIGKDNITVEEIFTGKYKLNTAIGVYSIPKHLGPHLSLTKEALRLDAETVLFRINVTNDGDKALEPVEITDILPDNMIFLNSSRRPTINGRNIVWSLISLAPGATRTLDLRAKLIGSLKENKVKAIGHYNDDAALAEASCAAFTKPCEVVESTQYNVTEDWCALPECTEECSIIEDDSDYYGMDDGIICSSCV